MAAPIFINGRFLAQNLTGVQRYASEMSSALCAIRPDTEILAPPGANLTLPRARIAGKRRGHAWEQLELPFAAGAGILLNPGNTAPLLGRRQVVVLHDAGVFSTPEAYSRPFRLWYKTLQFALSRRGVTIATVSHFSKRELVKHLRISPDRITVVGEGADHMRRITADPAALTALGLEPRAYVLAVGTLAAHKNLASLGILAERLRARGMALAVTGVRRGGVPIERRRGPAGRGQISRPRLRRGAENAIRQCRLLRVSLPLRRLRPAGGGGHGLRLRRGGGGHSGLARNLR
jgi:hypothetical protein